MELWRSSSNAAEWERVGRKGHTFPLRIESGGLCKWVGTERGILDPFLHPPRCHRACGFHRTRRPPPRTIILVSFRLPTKIPWYTGTGSYFEAPEKLWSFPLYVAFPRSEYYDHADSTQGHRRFSEWLPIRYISLSFAFPQWSPTFPMMDSTEPFRWWLSRQPVRLLRLSDRSEGITSNL
jgi:hypothetical protein